MENFLILSLIILVIGLWFSALTDIAHARFRSPAMNTVWLLIVLFFPVLGSVIYFLLKKQFTTTKPRQFRPNFTGTNK